VTAGKGATDVKEVRSADGTTIAFDRTGDGPPVILVGGAFHVRATEAPLAALLARRFSVLTYDRRGRGASGDTAPYAVAREVEDLEALLAEAGGSAFVYGVSTGAVLALEAAAHGLAIAKLALFEPPYHVDAAPSPRKDFALQLAERIAAGRRGDAVEFFLREGVGVPADSVAQMRNTPLWPALEGLAPTLLYDTAILGDTALPAQRLASVAAPTLVIDSGASPAYLRHAAQAAAGALPDARHHSLEGGFHDVAPEVLAPVLMEFFAGAPAMTPPPGARWRDTGD
jgi:pimeloyl-ACP methyl ester carboxylesterase